MARTVLVTGAAGEIGAAIAKRFCQAGYNVVLNFHLNAGENLQEEFPESARVFWADVAKADEAARMVEFAKSEFKTLDVVVNNAGVSLWQLFTDSTEADFNRVFDIDVKGVFNVCRAAVPHMVLQKSGRIVNISSIWGQVGASCEVIYSAAKAAVDGFSKALAKELGPSGITVNSVAPGVIDTKMNAGFGAKALESLKEGIPLGRLGKPEDIASAVLFLASEEAGFITGQVLGVNGAMA